MNKRTFFIGTVLLLGNLVTALPLNDNTRTSTDVSQLDYLFLKSVRNILIEHGLDREVAEQKTAALFEYNPDKAARSLHNLKIAFPEMYEDELIHYLSSRALSGRVIDLASYDTLVNILQYTKTPIENDKTYKKLQQVAHLNSVA